MNSNPENQPDFDEQEDLDSADLAQIESLIDLLVEDENTDAEVEINGDRQTDDLALTEIAELAKVDSDPIYQPPEPISNKVEEIEFPSESSGRVESEISTIEQVKAIDTHNASDDDLAAMVNSLIPLIVGLLEFKLDNSREGVVQTVRPMIDRLIAERTQEDTPKMAAAIARVLPAAITDEISQNPQAIAKAIAPEIALSIREQILLDEDAIPQALGSEMGKAIKAQIESEKDAMVDALYPVIGSTISKYMVEVVQDINSKVESTLSPEGIKRKFRAKIQGVSEAELIFKESIGYRVRAIFLIDKDSGLVIHEIQVAGEEQLDSDMLAGMLTAIRGFANDCIAAGSELDSIDYGDWQIPLEVAGYCYLAVIVAGEPPKEFITKIRRVLGEIVLEHDEAIENFNGNLAAVPTGIGDKLKQLTETKQDVRSQGSKSSTPILLWVLIFILTLVFVPWGISSYRHRVAQRLEQSVAVRLDAAPELSVYRLDPQVRNGKLIVKGRVPSEYLRDRATQVIAGTAGVEQLEIDNRIVAVDVPPEPSVIAAEVARLTRIFNQHPGVKIETAYSSSSLDIRGLVVNDSMRQTIDGGFSSIPGIKRVIFDLQTQLPKVKQRIYFASGSATLDFADNFSKIKAVKELLQQYPSLNLRLVVHSDNIGSFKLNQQLGIRRCRSVKTALVARGIKPERLIGDCNSLLLAENNDNGRAAWLRRYVSFKPFFPTNSQ